MEYTKVLTFDTPLSAAAKDGERPWNASAAKYSNAAERLRKIPKEWMDTVMTGDYGGCQAQVNS